MPNPRYIVLALVAAVGLQAQTPTDAEIRTILTDRIDKLEQGIGIVVGVIDANGRRFISHGHFSVADPRPVSDDTIFEIGSCTKVFTSTILAIMVQRGEVSLDDPVAKYLPPEVKIPQRGGKQITLVDLATHTSGLPRLPSSSADFWARNIDNPYADYPVAEIYRFLSGHQLTRDIGAKFEYSNLGAGLLGLALAHRAGMDYETLVRTYITGPLQMENTRGALSPAMKAQLAPSHNFMHQPVPIWDMPEAFAGAGGLRSDAQDMLTFLAVHLGYGDWPLSAALPAMTKVRRASDSPTVERALGWAVTKLQAHEIVWHSGGSGGHASFMGFDPKTRVGVVVLSNILIPDVEDIGMHLLDPSLPLAKLTPFVHRTAIPLTAEIIDRYVGVYQVKPGLSFTFTRESGRMFSKFSDQRKLEMLAEGERQFFLRDMDAQFTFETDRKGRGTTVTLYQLGHRMKAKRVE